MTVEIMTLITVASIFFGIYQGLCNLRRNKTTDDKRDASEMTTVIVKLESISTGVAKIETKMNTFELDIKADRERIIRVEESVKSLWKRNEFIEKKLEEKEGE